MRLRPYKVLVQVVVQEVDDDDVVIGERLTDTIPIFSPSPERLAAWWADLDGRLSELGANMEG